MTLKSRNWYIRLSSLIIIPIIVLFIQSLIVIPTEIKTIPCDSLLKTDLLIDLIINAFFILISIISAIIIFWNFRKTASIEIFFIICFLIISVFYASRPIVFILHLQNQSDIWQISIIRLTFIAHMTALMMLFFSGFFKIGFETARAEWAFLGTLLICFLLAGVQPIDLSILSKLIERNKSIFPSLLRIKSPNHANYFLFLTIIIPILSIQNYLIIWSQTRLKEYLFLGISIGALAISLILIAYKVFWQLEIIALFVYAAALIFFAIQSHKLYKWS